MQAELPLLMSESLDLLHIDDNKEDEDFLRSDRFQLSYERAIKNIDGRRSYHGDRSGAIYIVPHRVANALKKDKTCREKYLEEFLMLLEERLSGLFIVDDGRQYLYFIWTKSYGLKEALDFKLSCMYFNGKRFSGFEEMIWLDKKCRVSFSYLSASAKIKRGELVQDTAAFIGLTENCRVRQANSTDARWASNIYIVTEDCVK